MRLPCLRGPEATPLRTQSGGLLPLPEDWGTERGLERRDRGRVLGEVERQGDAGLAFNFYRTRAQTAQVLRGNMLLVG